MGPKMQNLLVRVLRQHEVVLGAFGSKTEQAALTRQKLELDILQLT